ncbi:MAG: glyoxalase [Methylococcaceae bacterium]|nr:glyoxalase [Methylococcaceae bacterium]
MVENRFTLHHASLIVSDTEQALTFYCGALGLQQIERPDLGFPGAWLSLGAEAQLHLLELPNPDPSTGRPDHGGRDRHVALMVASLEPIKDSLDKHHIRYTLSKSGRRAFFCRDLDGNAIEIIERP